MLSESHWSELEGAECAEQVVSICKGLRDDDGQRRKSRWLESWGRYEGKVFTDATLVGKVDETVRYNVSRSAVDTAQAEIAARQRPKPMFLTSGADWKTKRRAKKLDRFVEAHLHQSQGARYADAWELTEDVFRDASQAVGGVVKVVVDYANERIRLERIPAYEILVDPMEAEGGDPQNWFHCYTMSLPQALVQFAVGKSKDAELIRARIRNSAKSEYRGSTFRAVKQVEIFEGWYLPPSAGEPGKHVFACEDGILFEEDWTWPCPPIAILVWSREAYGVWGSGLVESGAGQHDRIQEIAEKIHKRFDENLQRDVYIEKGMVDETQLTSTDTTRYIPVHDMSKVPQIRDIPPINPSEAQFLDTEIDRYYEMQGVSQMSATSRKDPGVDAAVAMQTLNDIKTVRFMPKARAYELLFVRIGELIVRAARDLAVEKKDLAVRWPGKRFFESIAWNDVSIEEDMYTVRVAPVSAMSRDPAQRLQIVTELARSGYLPKEKYFELLGMPDLDSLFDQETSESTWTQKMIDRYLDADDGDDLDKRGGYAEPDGLLLNPDAALMLVGQHYFDALANDVPVFNANLMRRFMTSLQNLIGGADEGDAQAAQAAAAQAGAGVAPVAAGQTAMPMQVAA